MHIETEQHGEMSCQIEVNEAMDHYVGTLRYKVFEVGLLSGPSVEAVGAQFRAICKMTDAGGMVRHGCRLARKCENAAVSAGCGI